MDAKNFAVDNRSKDKEVENLAAGLPHRGVPILLRAFFVETVDLGDLAGFVVAANQGDATRVAEILDLAWIGRKDVKNLTML